MSRITRIITCILGLFTLTNCGKKPCSMEKTKEIIANTNAYLMKQLSIQEDFFSSEILDITSSGQIMIKNNEMPEILARKFVDFRADQHEAPEKKEHYLKRFEDKLPSTSAILEASVKLAHKGKDKPCSFVAVVYENSNKGEKIISLL